METALSRAIDRLDEESLCRRYRDQEEFVFVENFLRPEEIEPLLSKLPSLRPRINRNYLPTFKKGGSISRYRLSEECPAAREMYESQSFRAFLDRLSGEELELCPCDDAHAYALYSYSEPGDHIGFHYDISHYKGDRYTILLGLVDQSSCELVCDLYHGDDERKTRRISVSTPPGSLVVFNGEKLYHKVTPLKQGEERIVLAMEYLTDPSISSVRWAISQAKDALAYFGFRQLISRILTRSGG